LQTYGIKRKKKYHTVGTIPTLNIEIVEIDTRYTQIQSLNKRSNGRRSDIKWMSIYL